MVTSADPPSQCSSSCSLTVPAGATVVLRAVSLGVNVGLAGWHGACTGRATVCEIDAEEDESVSATFALDALGYPRAFALDVTRSGGGSVSSTPLGVIDCGSVCATGFSGGASVTLSATPAAGNAFAGWRGACTGNGACTVAMTQDRSVTASFAPTPAPTGTSTLTLHNHTPPPSGGFGSAGTAPVRVEWGGHSDLCEAATCLYTIDNATPVTLTGVVSTSTGLRKWEGACVGSSPICVISGGPAVVDVTFFNLLASTSDLGINVTRYGGGRVASTPSGITCGDDDGCSAGFREGVSVLLHATPDPGREFDGWGGDCTGTGDCRLPMNVSHQVTARFGAAHQVVKVAKIGNGSGTVTSDPAGINCGDVCSAAFRMGATLTMTATPGGQSRFAGWSGACSGASCSIGVSAPTSISARFVRCAASTAVSLHVTTTKRPRRIKVLVGVGDDSRVTIQVMAGGRVLARADRRRTGSGLMSANLAVPRRAHGRVIVKVKLVDACGAVATLSRTVRLP
jgi:hypothetical protein